LSIVHNYPRGAEGTTESTATEDALSTDWSVHSKILRFCQNHTGESGDSEEKLQYRQQDIGLTYSSVLFVC
jgi:hypothetical protein